MRIVIVSFIFALIAISNICQAFTADRYFPLAGADYTANDYFKSRFLPTKERRARLDAFDDMSGFLREIDGIQKPRFG